MLFNFKWDLCILHGKTLYVGNYREWSEKSTEW
jgi:hypothetical protein